MFFRRVNFAIAFLVCVLGFGHQSQAQGDTDGKLVELREDFSIAINKGSSVKSLSRKEFEQWGRFEDAPSHSQIIFNDGSILVSNVRGFSEEKLLIDSRNWAEQQIAISQIACVCLVPKSNLAKRYKQLDELLSAEKPTIWFANGDQIPGEIVEIEKRFRRNDSQKVRIRTKSGMLTRQIDEIAAFSSGKSTRTRSQRRLSLIPSETKLLVGFSDSSLMKVTRVQVDEEAKIYHLVCGAKLKTSGFASDSKSIRMVRNIFQNEIFLSDLKPLRTTSKTMTGTEFPIELDRNCLGSPLSHEGHITLKGIGMHAKSSIIFSLPKNSSRFKSHLVIDDSSGNRGSVIGKVLFLTAGKWSKPFETKVVRGSDSQPIQIDTPIEEGASAIAIQVNAADSGSVLDRANWLNARVVID